MVVSETSPDPTSAASGSSEPSAADVHIERAAGVDDELVEAFARLIPQLSSSSPPPTAEHLRALVSSPDTVLFLARVDGVVVGSLTLAFYRIPTGLKAWIEDVVVDADARGTGVGELLNSVALEEARDRGAKDVSLTSRPSREAANRLYRRIGFEPRDTNVYRYTF
jgi:ribosomal protein S18 acetylase RimI-like enzyme